MKCVNHPDRDAVGICVSCGAGVCHECEVKIGGRTYCKNCVESGRTAAVSEEIRYGAPSKPLFIVGAIGMLILLIVAQLPWLYAWIFFWTIPYSLYSYMQMVSMILIGVGVTIGSFAFIGFKRNYDSGLGLATFIISLVFTWFLPAGTILMWMFMPYWWAIGYIIIGIIFYLVGIILLGVAFILWGVTLIMVRHHTGKGGLAMGSGILYIIAGAFWCSLFLSFVYGAGSIMLIPAGVLGMVALFLAQTEAA